MIYEPDLPMLEELETSLFYYPMSIKIWINSHAQGPQTNNITDRRDQVQAISQDLTLDINKEVQSFNVLNLW